MELVKETAFKLMQIKVLSVRKYYESKGSFIYKSYDWFSPRSSRILLSSKAFLLVYLNCFT